MAYFLKISDYFEVPDTATLSERLRVCLQESDDLPTENTKLFNQKLFSISGDKVPDVLEAYSLLNVKYEPLKLIKPQFETPLPALQCAVSYILLLIFFPKIEQSTFIEYVL